MFYKVYGDVVSRNSTIVLNELISNRIFVGRNNYSLSEPLHLASPNLTRMLEEESDADLEIPLYKYLSRAATRCTPFGLFAGCSVVNWGEQTNVVFNGSKRVTRLDYEYNFSVLDHLYTNKDLTESLKYYLNNTIYESGDFLRYLEYTLVKGKRHYALSQVEKMEELTVLLKHAQEGATAVCLATAITTEEITFDEASEFVYSLIENKLLLSELEPCVTGGNYLKELCHRLSRYVSIPKISEIRSKLLNIDQLLTGLDVNIQNEIGDYKKILAEIDTLGIPYEENRIFQVDLFKTTGNNSIDSSLQKELEKGINALYHLSGNHKYVNLERFKAEFLKRYQDKEIPLLVALDTETGLGYPEALPGNVTPLIKDLHISQQKQDKATIGRKDKLLAEILQNAYLQNQYIVDISEHIPKQKEKNWAGMPPSFQVMFKVSNFKTNEIVIESVGGSSGINLLGRFAHTDNQINEICKDIAQQEQEANKNVVFAEISHIPENRTGNVIAHPPFRDYEIPILSPSNNKEATTIPLEDLLVSVKSDRILLRSKKLNKEIIPRLSNAHNYSLSELPVYRFLCDMQTQGLKSSLGFSWGAIASNFSFLPRVCYGKVILKLATWQLQKKEWAHLLKSKNKEEEIGQFLTKWEIPQQVVLAEGDNELFIDFSNKLAVKTLLHTIKGKDSIVLKEFLIDKDSPIKDKEGQSYASQFISFFVNPEPVYKGMSESSPDKLDVQREFQPGTEWVYLKYYCGATTADMLLSELITPLANQFLEEKKIDQWFFIRYKDPEPHLRVRFRLTNLESYGALMVLNAQNCQKYISTGQLWRIESATYVRELERYGNANIELSEQFFYYDSQVISQYLKAQEDDENENSRWLFALWNINEIYECFGFTLEDKLKHAELFKKSFYKEFEVEKKTKLQIDKNFRAHRPLIETNLNTPEKSIQSLKTLNGEITKSLENRKRVLVEINNRHKEGEVPELLTSLISSYIHMHVNRLLSYTQRLQEMIIYDYMYRYYKSKKAREEK